MRHTRRAPGVTVEVGSDSITGRAVLAEGEERQRLFDAMVAVMPGFGAYQQGTERLIPVVGIEVV